MRVSKTIKGMPSTVYFSIIAFGIADMSTLRKALRLALELVQNCTGRGALFDHSIRKA
ncbi:MAG: hypothetical protein ACLQBD_23720 [Syntrophobacteraceae bacterium]